MKETMREQPVRASVYVDAGGRWSRQQCGWSHQREHHAAANQQTTGWEDLSAHVRVFLSWSTCIQCWLLVVNLDACDLVIMPRPLGGALSNDAVWHLSVWRLSVAYIGPKSRTARSRKTKIGTEIAHVTRDSDTTFKVKKSKVNVTGAGHIVTASRLQLVSWIVVYRYTCNRVISNSFIQRLTVANGNICSLLERNASYKHKRQKLKVYNDV